MGAELDIGAVREDFPILRQSVRGKPLVYLDSAATSQKPRQILEAVDAFYAEDYGSVHRGVYALAERATARYEDARRAVQRFIGASDPREVVFLRGTTEAINLVASSYGRKNLGAGDEIVITHMEHHSNIVPWQRLCEETGAVLKVAPITDAGELDMDALAALIGARTKLVSVVYVSNALGTVNPVRQIADLAHAQGAVLLVDGAQAVPHLRIDVEALGCDFFAFSGHKLYAPTGIGVLWGRYALLAEMPPYQGGGHMITSVTFEKTTYAKPPARFEAGTPDAGGAIGLMAAIAYVERLGLERIAAHEHALLGYAVEQLGALKGVRLIGTPKARAGSVSFVLDAAHPHDIASVLDRDGVCVRAGHHCTQPIMQRYGVPATTRASFAVYNTKSEIDALVTGLLRVQKMFG